MRSISGCLTCTTYRASIKTAADALGISRKHFYSVLGDFRFACIKQLRQSCLTSKCALPTCNTSAQHVLHRMNSCQMVFVTCEGDNLPMDER